MGKLRSSSKWSPHKLIKLSVILIVLALISLFLDLVVVTNRYGLDTGSSIVSFAVFTEMAAFGLLGYIGITTKDSLLRVICLVGCVLCIFVIWLELTHEGFWIFK